MIEHRTKRVNDLGQSARGDDTALGALLSAGSDLGELTLRVALTEEYEYLQDGFDAAALLHIAPSSRGWRLARWNGPNLLLSGLRRSRRSVARRRVRLPIGVLGPSLAPPIRNR